MLIYIRNFILIKFNILNLIFFQYLKVNIKINDINFDFSSLMLLF